jgi:hypothetical protein
MAARQERGEARAVDPLATEGDRRAGDDRRERVEHQRQQRRLDAPQRGEVASLPISEQNSSAPLHAAA